MQVQSSNGLSAVLSRLEDFLSTKAVGHRQEELSQLFHSKLATNREDNIWNLIFNETEHQVYVDGGIDCLEHAHIVSRDYNQSEVTNIFAEKESIRR